MSKMTKTILSISAAIIAVAGIAVLIVHFWDHLSALCPCCKKKTADAEIPEPEAADDAIFEN